MAGSASEFAGVVAGGGDQAAVGESGKLEVKGAVLEGAVDFAGAAELEVDFGKIKTVGGFGELAEAAGRGLVAGGEEVTAGGLVAATDPTAELVKLSEAIVFGVLDDDHVGIGNVNTDFNDSGGDQNVGTAGGEIGHDLIFLGRAEFAVEQADPVIGEKLGEFLGLAFDGSERFGGGRSGRGFGGVLGGGG